MPPKNVHKNFQISGSSNSGSGVNVGDKKRRGVRLSLQQPKKDEIGAAVLEASGRPSYYDMSELEQEIEQKTQRIKETARKKVRRTRAIENDILYPETPAESEDQSNRTSSRYAIGLDDSINSLNQDDLDMEIDKLSELFEIGFLQEEEFETQLRLYKRKLEYSTTHFATVPFVDYNSQLCSVSNSNSFNDRSTHSRNVRFFISSTFSDMAPERDVLIKFVFPRLKKLCHERGVFLSQIDLRWGITAEQSKQGDTIAICLKEIDKSRPYFMCILGGRYGWNDDTLLSLENPHECLNSNQAVPPSRDPLLRQTFQNAVGAYPWIASYCDRSITELELRHAVLNDLDSETAKRALIYIKDKVPRDNVKLENLCKELVGSGQQVHYYEEANELADLVYERIKKLIDRDFPLEHAISQVEQDRLPHEVYRESRCRVYIGKESYFEQLDQHVLSPTTNTPIVIFGDKGYGKSSLCCNWSLRYQRSFPNKVVISHFIGISQQSTDLGRMLTRIMGELKEKLGLERAIPRANLAQLVAEFPEWLMDASVRGGCVLVIDGLNRLQSSGEADNAMDLSWLPARLPANVKVVVSRTVASASEFTRKQWPLLRLAPLTATERKMMVTRYLELYGKSLTPEQLESVVTCQSCASPLFLKLLIEEIRTHGKFETLTAKIEKYLAVETPVQLLEMIFLQLEEEFATNGSIDQPRLQLPQQPTVALPKSVKTVGRGRGRGVRLLVTHRTTVEEEMAVESPSPQLSLLDSYYNHLVAPVQSPSPSSSIVKSFFSSLYIARRGLKEDEALEILSLNHSTITPSLFSRLICQIDSFVSDTSGYYTFFHDYMRIAVKKRYFPANFGDVEDEECDAEDCDEGLDMQLKREELYRYFMSGNEAIALERIVDEVPYQLLRLKKWDSLCEFISNMDYFRELNKENNRFDLYRYWSAVQAHTPDYLEMQFAASVERELWRITEAKYGGFDEVWRLISELFTVTKVVEDIGNYNLAETLFRTILNACKQNDLDDVIIAESEALLGYCLRLKGVYSEAVTLYLSALEVMDRKYKTNNPNLATTINGLAMLYRYMGQYEKALPLYEKALAIRLYLFGSRAGSMHVDIAQSYNSLGCLYLDMCRYKEAEEYLLIAIEQREKLLGVNHQDVAMSLTNLGGLYVSQCRYVDGKATYQKALKIYENLFGPDHPGCSQCLNCLAGISMEEGKYQECEGLYESVLTLKGKLFGTNHPEYALTLNDMGGLYLLLDKYEESDDYYQNCLDIRREVLGEDHPDTAQTYSNLGLLRREEGNYVEAEKYFLQCQAITEKVFSRVHMDNAACLKNLASVYQLKGEYDKAIGPYNAALDIYKALLGEKHVETALLLNDYAVLNYFKGNFIEAEALYVRSCKMYLDIFGPDHPETAQSLKNVDSFYECIGQPGRAHELLEAYVAV